MDLQRCRADHLCVSAGYAFSEHQLRRTKCPDLMPTEQITRTTVCYPRKFPPKPPPTFIDQPKYPSMKAVGLTSIIISYYYCFRA